VHSRIAPLLVAAAAMAGCNSSNHFPDESRDAEQAIKRAEDAGASQHSRAMLESARDLRDHAKRAEEEAQRDSKDAHEQLRMAQKRGARADQGLKSARRRKKVEEDTKQEYLATLDRQREHAEELRSKGVTEEEIQRLTETDNAITNLHVRSCDSAIAALEKEIELYELEKLDAQLTADAAKTRLDAVEKRLEVARLLFRAAQEEARVAEGDALEEKRAREGARINSM
jgi:hypothetical protein